MGRKPVSWDEGLETGRASCSGLLGPCARSPTTRRWPVGLGALQGELRPLSGPGNYVTVQVPGWVAPLASDVVDDVQNTPIRSWTAALCPCKRWDGIGRLHLWLVVLEQNRLFSGGFPVKCPRCKCVYFVKRELSNMFFSLKKQRLQCILLTSLVGGSDFWMLFLKRKLFDSSSQAHRRIVSWDADIVATDGSDHS